MQKLKIAALALLGFASLSCAWFVNRWDYESAYIRGLGDGGSVGFVKGYQQARQDLRRDAASPLVPSSQLTGHVAKASS